MTQVLSQIEFDSSINGSKITMSATYTRVSQLIPSGTYTTFQLIASTVGVAGGPDTPACELAQTILLWLAVAMVSIACFVSSFVGDATVKYATSVTINLPMLERFTPPRVIHAILATVALLVIILVDQATFECLTGVILDPVIVRSVPIVTGTIVVSVYGFLFSLPATPAGVTRVDSVA
jgi:hypothetical protein